MKNEIRNNAPNLKMRSYQYSISLIQVMDSLPGDTSMRVIVHQLLRSATSIGANIVEAQSASSRRDFINFYTHALKSSNETVYWLGLLRDAKNLNQPKINGLYSEAKELANILAACILTLKGKR